MAIERVRPIDRILEIFYSFAAVPVLLGALFKITHTSPFGSPNGWLYLGLGTEAIVFASFGVLYIFRPPKAVDEMGLSIGDFILGGSTTAGNANINTDNNRNIEMKTTTGGKVAKGGSSSGSIVIGGGGYAGGGSGNAGSGNVGGGYTGNSGKVSGGSGNVGGGYASGGSGNASGGSTIIIGGGSGSESVGKGGNTGEGNVGGATGGGTIVIGGSGSGSSGNVVSGGGAATQQGFTGSGFAGEQSTPLGMINDMLVNANITPESLNKLSLGFKTLEASIDHINTLKGSLTDTQEYSKKMQEAITALTAINNFYHKIAETSQTMINSAEEAKRTQEQLGVLAQNLAKLNQVYGGMLIAMQMGTRPF